MRTYNQVKKEIQERLPETIEDIQHLLENNCGNLCKECEFQYLCIREKDEK
jgi:CRISPR/Cas system-associated exonuclease Cas4 (RecB family)